MKNLTRPISVKRWKPPVLAVFSAQFLAVFSEDLHQDRIFIRQQSEINM